MKGSATRILLLGVLLASLGARGAAADSEPEPIGVVRALPAQPGPHWFWLSDLLLHRTALFDADSGDMLGAISAGTAGVGMIVSPLFSPDHAEIYVAETYYSRGVRGERTDVVTVYDARTLKPAAEIPIPPKRAEYYPGNAPNALSDDGRFLAVFNLTPMTSLSIIDVRARRFVSEVQTPGCSLVYAAGPRRFFMLCANGSALTVTLDDEGREQAVERTAAFFDPNKDPITEKAVRRGNEWLFVSFEGQVHPVDVSARSSASASRGRSSTTRTARRRGASAAGSIWPCMRRRADSTRSCTRAGRTRTRARARRSGSTISRAAAGCSASR